jgi:hypothetical protein
MTQGYLLFALNTDNVDYVKLAYACALSIKLTQPDGYNSVALVTNVDVANSIFDHVIKYTGPQGMNARSRAYDYSPYDTTVLLDADMLFLKDMSNYWKLFSDRDLFITTSPQTYRGDQFKYGYYRKVFDDNLLPDVYNAWTYFKKSPIAKEFFDTVILLTDNAEHFIEQCLSGSNLTSIPTDEAFAIALGMLDLTDIATEPRWDFPRVTHMKPMVQGWNEYVKDWVDKLRFHIGNNMHVELGMFAQTELLHYVDKSIITDSIIARMEQAYGA